MNVYSADANLFLVFKYIYYCMFVCIDKSRGIIEMEEVEVEVATLEAKDEDVEMELEDVEDQVMEVEMEDLEDQVMEVEY